MQPLKCSAGVVEPAPGAAAGLGRWFMGVWWNEGRRISSSRSAVAPIEYRKSKNDGRLHYLVFYVPLCSVRIERFGPKMVVAVFLINSVVVVFSKRSHSFVRRII